MSEILLNPAQRAAVEHGRGPLLIVAGAGTGKTRVLIERVGYLLRTMEGLQPEHILALTFSNKAANEMRRRAAERFGEIGSRCRFSTFHAFCYELLAETGPSRALDPIDQWIFLRRRLEELQLEHYFKVSEPGRFLSNLVEFCSRCHDNLVTPAEYSEYIERLAADCAKKRDTAAQCEEEEIDRQREVARVFTTLERLQEEQGLLSFGSMISRAVRLLDSSLDLLARLQGQYPFLLVDEFQDTNTAQFELLVRLAGQSRNLTVVGDDDQAIYRFRGASYASFQQFEERYPEHVRIVLDRNYRSTKSILDVAGVAIAANSQDRYMPDKKLSAAGGDGPGVEVWEFSDDVAQAEYLAQHIAEETQHSEARRYSDYAVLYRAHSHRNRLVEALRRREIPFEIRKLAINDTALVRDLLAVLRVIGDASDSVSLVRLLADPQWKMQPQRLVEHCGVASSRRVGLWELISQSGSAQEWTRREDFIEFRNRYAARTEKERLRDWFPVLCAELSFPRNAEDHLAFDTFASFLLRWDKEKSSTGRLREFLEYFQYFEEAGGVMALGEQEELAAFTNAGGEQMSFSSGRDEDVRGKVQLMTVHGAKGLEFERVYVWHLVRRGFPSYHRKPLIELPPALWKGPLPRGDFHIEEERRLFYVALTRARRSLVLSTISNPKQRPSPFVEQLEEVPPPTLVRKHPIVRAEEVPGGKNSAAGGKVADSGTRLAEWVGLPLPAAKGERTGDLTLSVSQLESYEQCPLKYRFAQHWRIPVPPAPALQFGMIIHAAVKDVVARVAQKADAVTDQDVEGILKGHWNAVHFQDKLQEQRYLRTGIEQLEGVRRAWSGRKFLLLYQEKTFDLKMGGCKVVGRIDQLHRTEDGEYHLIEYKTGRPQTQKEADRSQQLTLYAHACEEVLGLRPVHLTLYNLTNQERLRSTRGAEEVRKLEGTIRETARQIQAGRFPPQPGFHCRFCAFQAICPAQEQNHR